MIKNTALILARFPFEKDWTIRIVLPGIDEGSAIYLETSFDGEKTREQVEAMLDKIVKELPSVVKED